MRAAQQRPPSSRAPITGSPLRGVSKRAQQGQSAGCSGQDLFTSNHESMQLRGEKARGTRHRLSSCSSGLGLRAGFLRLTHEDPTPTVCWLEGAGHSDGCWLSRRPHAVGWHGVGLGPQEAGSPASRGTRPRGRGAREDGTATTETASAGGCERRPSDRLQGLKSKEGWSAPWAVTSQETPLPGCGGPPAASPPARRWPGGGTQERQAKAGGEVPESQKGLSEPGGGRNGPRMAFCEGTRPAICISLPQS